MSKSLKRLIFVLLALPLLLVAVTLVYMAGMTLLEGSPRTFLRSLEWAAETLTTTGYGSENTWGHPVMVLFVVTVQFLGALLVFLVVPIALVPFLEQRFEVKLPRRVPRMEDHLVILHYGPAVATLLGEVEQAGISTLVVEDDPVIARRLVEKHHRVLSVRSRESSSRSRVRSERSMSRIFYRSPSVNVSIPWRGWTDGRSSRLHRSCSTQFRFLTGCTR